MIEEEKKKLEGSRDQTSKPGPGAASKPVRGQHTSSSIRGELLLFLAHLTRLPAVWHLLFFL